MSDDDKKVFANGRAYVVGVIALAYSLRAAGTIEDPEAFDLAEGFVKEFEKRNGIKGIKP